MGIINKTLMEVTRDKYHRLYKKMFQVKEHYYSEDQEIIIDLCSIYTDLEGWTEFLDKYGEDGWNEHDLYEHFGIEIAETHWVRKRMNDPAGDEWLHLDTISDIKKASWSDQRKIKENEALMIEQSKYPGEEELHAE